MTKTQIKKAFKDCGIQLGKGSMELIEREIQQKVLRLVSNCQEGNVKRLTPEIFWIAIGREYRE